MRKGIALVLLIVICALPLMSLADSYWICPSCGRLNDGNYCSNDATPRPSNSGNSGSSSVNTGSLSPNNKCPVTPSFYRNVRFRNVGSNTEADYNQGLSVARIIKDQGTREYGIYLKFTPNRSADGYVINRMDVVITGPSGEKLFTEGFPTNMTCQYRYYWYFPFYSLDDFFKDQISKTGTIATGKYLMDIYFNQLWAGQINFKIGK